MSQMRPVPAAAARGVHTSWRALSAAEAAAAALLDVLAVLLPAVAVGLGLGSGPLAWIVALEVLVLLVLMEARSGRTPGLLAVSATSCAPARGSAPGLGRAAARAALRPLLPLRRRPAGRLADSAPRRSVLDLLTGTVTLTSRPAPGGARRGRAVGAGPAAPPVPPERASAPAPPAAPAPEPAAPTPSTPLVPPSGTAPASGPTLHSQFYAPPAVEVAPWPAPAPPPGAAASTGSPALGETAPQQVQGRRARRRRVPSHRAATPPEAP